MTNKRKLRIVLNSVVVVSAFLTEGIAADMVSRCQESVYLYTTEEILQEIRRVLLDKLTYGIVIPTPQKKWKFSSTI